LFAGLTETVTGWLKPPCGMVMDVAESVREKSAGVTGAGAGLDRVEAPLQPERRKREKSRSSDRFSKPGTLRGSQCGSE
jgi:hypothetical protein